MLTREQREKLRQFHQDGLLWMVNTSLLHPRGFALSLSFDTDSDEPDLPTGMFVVGSDEPWIFAPGEQTEVLRSYEEAEARREHKWSAALGGNDG